jgi:translation initiation factor 1
VLRRERAHRGGKTVIVIDDFATHLPISVIEKTAKKIRLACGCGGTVKDRAIEIQGDQPGKIRAILETEGFLVAGVK